MRSRYSNDFEYFPFQLTLKFGDDQQSSIALFILKDAEKTSEG
jgi:hypothetical protein